MLTMNSFEKYCKGGYDMFDVKIRKSEYKSIVTGLGDVYNTLNHDDRPTVSEIADMCKLRSDHVYSILDRGDNGNYQCSLLELSKVARYLVQLCEGVVPVRVYGDYLIPLFSVCDRAKMDPYECKILIEIVSALNKQRAKEAEDAAKEVTRVWEYESTTNTKDAVKVSTPTEQANKLAEFMEALDACGDGPVPPVVWCKAMLTSAFIATPDTRAVAQANYEIPGTNVKLERGEDYELLGVISGLGYILVVNATPVCVPGGVCKELLPTVELGVLEAMLASQSIYTKESDWLEVEFHTIKSRGGRVVFRIREEKSEESALAMLINCGDILFAYTKGAIRRVTTGWVIGTEFYIPVTHIPGNREELVDEV